MAPTRSTTPITSRNWGCGSAPPWTPTCFSPRGTSTIRSEITIRRRTGISPPTATTSRCRSATGANPGSSWSKAIAIWTTTIDMRPTSNRRSCPGRWWKTATRWTGSGNSTNWARPCRGACPTSSIWRCPIAIRASIIPTRPTSDWPESRRSTFRKGWTWTGTSGNCKAPWA